MYFFKVKQVTWIRRENEKAVVRVGKQGQNMIYDMMGAKGSEAGRLYFRHDPV
jgi:hypothetical protein